MGILNKVNIDSSDNNGQFQLDAQNIDYTIPGSTVKTSVANILKTLTGSIDGTGLTPIEHSSESSEYGAGTSVKYGHIKVGDGLIPPKGDQGYDILPFRLRNLPNQVAMINNNSNIIYLFIADSNFRSNPTDFWLLTEEGFSILRNYPASMSEFNGYVTSFGNSFFFFGDANNPTTLYKYNYNTSFWSSNTFDYDITIDNSILLFTDYFPIIMTYSFNNNGYIFYGEPTPTPEIPTLEISTSPSYLAGFASFNKNISTIQIIDVNNSRRYTTNKINGVWSAWTSELFIVGIDLIYPSMFFYLNERGDYTSFFNFPSLSKEPYLIHAIFDGDTFNVGNSFTDGTVRPLRTILYLNNKFYTFAISNKLGANPETLVYSCPADGITTIFAEDSLPIIIKIKERLLSSNLNNLGEPKVPLPTPAIESDGLSIDSKAAVFNDNPQLFNQREPFSHASLEKKYGVSTVDLYGHSKLVDDYTNVGLNTSSGSITISELPTAVWQRHNVAINKNGEILAIGSFDFDNSRWTPAYSFYSITHDIIENQSDFVIYDLDSCQVEFLDDNTCIVAGSYSPSYAGLYMYKVANNQWTRLPDLPYNFYNDEYSGQLAKQTFTSPYWGDDSVLIMLYNSDVNGYVFYWYNEDDGLIEAFEESDYLPYTYSYDLTLVITPTYYAVLDITNQKMWQHSLDYSGGWTAASFSLPIESYSYSYPSAVVYGDDFTSSTWTSDSVCYLHIIGRNSSTYGIFHGILDLYNMEWTFGNTTNVSLRGYDSYNGEYSLILMDNHLYLFADTVDNTTKIYSCRADITDPVWIEDSIVLEESGGGSESTGGNGMVASSYSVNMLKKDMSARITPLMLSRDFTRELREKIEEYIGINRRT